MQHGRDQGQPVRLDRWDVVVIRKNGDRPASNHHSSVQLIQSRQAERFGEWARANRDGLSKTSQRGEGTELRNEGLALAAE